MKRPVRLLPEARVEFHAAIEWYELKRQGLGITFVTRVREVLERIALDPQCHATVYLDIRKAIVPSFPYVVFYREVPEEILVISVFPTSRNPSGWKNRIRS